MAHKKDLTTILLRCLFKVFLGDKEISKSLYSLFSALRAICKFGFKVEKVIIKGKISV
jgi:hypothetical protein